MLSAVDEDALTISLEGAIQRIGGDTAETGFTFSLVEGEDTHNALFTINGETGALVFIGTDGLAAVGASGSQPGDNGRLDVGEIYSVRIRIVDSTGNEGFQIFDIAEGSLYLTDGGVRRYSTFRDDDGNGLLDGECGWLAGPIALTGGGFEGADRYYG